MSKPDTDTGTTRYNACAGVAHYRLRQLLRDRIGVLSPITMGLGFGGVALAIIRVQPVILMVVNAVAAFSAGLLIALLCIDHWNTRQFKSWSEGCKEERGV